MMVRGRGLGGRMHCLCMGLAVWWEIVQAKGSVGLGWISSMRDMLSSWKVSQACL